MKNTVMDTTRPFEPDSQRWRLRFGQADYLSPEGEVLKRLTYQFGAWWDGNFAFLRIQEAMERIERNVR
jgi:hypothetical protein